MDNSPLWDEALQRMSLDPARMPEYERVDVRVADAAERPSDAEYDRYVYLVGLFRELAYEPSRIREAVPFALQPVLFNSLLVRSNQDLAEIARVARLGRGCRSRRGPRAPPPAWRACGTTSRRCTSTTTSSPRKRVRVARPPVSRRCTRASHPSRAERMVERLAGSRVAGRGLGLGRDEPLARRSGLPADALLARAGVADPELGAPARPRALRVPGASPSRCRHAVVDLGRSAGFWEHYDPLTGKGHGGEQFAWTAALVLDLLQDGGARRESRGEGTLTSTAFLVTPA